MDFNSMNDQRKNQKLPYATPQTQIKDYAKELGMELYEPYSASDEAKREGMQLRETISKKDAILREQAGAIDAMKNQISELTAMMGKIMQFGATQIAAAPVAAAVQPDTSAFEPGPQESKSKRSK